ncbi:GMC oxidoreductase [Thozetella sp. PMI_491]|nr:GMC oxidoreductase [Thozetella sp. PMI_491]
MATRKLGLLPIIVLTASLACLHAGALPHDSSYDYVIVGGGTSGLVLANRFSEDRKVTVLVVEYGDFENTWDTALPYNANFNHPAVMFNITSAPQAGLGNRTSTVPAGAVVGGGSAVNGMTFDRGSRADYDAWEELGNPGWGWESLFPYFKKSETLSPPPQAYQEAYNFTWEPHDYGYGPVQAGFPRWQWPNTPMSRAAYLDAGIPWRDDGGADGNNVGLAWIPENIDPNNVTRSYSRTAYYNPAASRSNLRLLTNSYVSTIILERGTAKGVNIVSRQTGELSIARAKEEVILAAGSIHTPQILQLSGIGPEPALRSLGIKPNENLPGVGANFQDHPTTRMSVNYTSQLPVNPTILSNATYYAAAWAEYLANRTGPLTQAHGQLIAFLSLQQLTPDYQTIAASLIAQNATAYLPAIYSAEPSLLAGFLAQRAILASRFNAPNAAVLESLHTNGVLQPAYALQKPVSRGTVLVKSTSPNPQDAAPVVDWHTLSNPTDVELAILAFRFSRRILSAPSLAPLGPVETVPGPGVTSDADIEAALRLNIMVPSFAHPCCTAAMMPRELGGVVDSQLRVYGVDKLRVVDASIMPLIPATHLQETVYAVAEKAADIIKASRVFGDSASSTEPL